MGNALLEAISITGAEFMAAGKPSAAGLPDIYRKMEYTNGTVYEQVTLPEFFDCCTVADLKHFRAIINGKIGKRKITPEQQAKMQA